MSASIVFPPFRLDIGNARLERDGEAVPLRSKALALLHYLAERPGRLVTKEELLDAVWPDVVVSEVSLKVCVREVRKALADDARQPRFVETVHRRGYRFIAPVAAGASVGAPVAAPQPSVGSREPLAMVGREEELRQLRDWLHAARGGDPHVVFVRGVAGIGKTTLVQALLNDLGEGPCRVARGLCVEQYGSGEPFMPVLEGLMRLCRREGGEEVVELLREHAPSWLLQLPGLLAPAERDEIRRQYAGMIRPKMLRELVVGLETLTAEVPLVLVLEDLQWSDVSTVDLLTALARSREPSRLLVLGTYRSGEVEGSLHPLVATVDQLRFHRCCEELALGPLDEEAVRRYLELRFASAELAGELAPVLHRQSSGNPLFAVSLVDHLLLRGWIAARDGSWSLEITPAEVAREVPASLRQLLDRQLELLDPEERRILEAASVAGVEFSSPVVAAALDVKAGVVEASCADLAGRRLFLRLSGSCDWPDGTAWSQYEFLHPLYRTVLHDRVEAPRRVRAHRRITRRLESAYVADTAPVAARLADHSARGNDLPRAVQYLRQAGDKAVQQHAYEEAIAHYRRGLELVTKLPGGTERDRQELELQIGLGVPMLNTRGYGAPEVEAAHSRALELCEQVGDPPHLFRALEGLHTYYAVRGDLNVAFDLAQRLFALGRSRRDPAMILEGHHTVGCTELRRANLDACQSHLEAAIRRCDSVPASQATLWSGHDPKTCCLGHLGVALWMAGLPDQALARGEEALHRAHEVSHPNSVGVALSLLAWIHLLRGEGEAARQRADELVALADRHGFPYHSAFGLMLRGRGLALAGAYEESLQLLRHGFAVCEAIGAGVGRLDYLVMLGQVCELDRRPTEGLAAVSEAIPLVEERGERLLEAEVYRLRAELRRMLAEEGGDVALAGAGGEVESDLCRALDVARRREMRSLELRVAISLARLLERTGDRERARELLTPLHDSLGEGLATHDAEAAAELLEELRAT